MAMKIKHEDLDFDSSGLSAVEAGKQNFIIPIPKGEGALNYPFGHEKSGPVEGIGDDAVAIISNVTPEQANDLYAKVHRLILGTDTPEGIRAKKARERDFSESSRMHQRDSDADCRYRADYLKRDDVNNVLSYASSLGLKEIDYSDREDIGKTVSVGINTQVDAYGLFREVLNDCEVCFVEGRDIEFTSSTGSTETFPNGMVAVRQDGEVTGVSPADFEERYTDAGGNPMRFASLLALQAITDDEITDLSGLDTSKYLSYRSMTTSQYGDGGAGERSQRDARVANDSMASKKLEIRDRLVGEGHDSNVAERVLDEVTSTLSDSVQKRASDAIEKWGASVGMKPDGQAQGGSQDVTEGQDRGTDRAR